MVYYGHAAVCLVLFLLWVYFYNDHPRVNKFVSDVELEKINRGKSDAHINMDKFLPYTVGNQSQISNKYIQKIRNNLQYKNRQYKTVAGFNFEINKDIPKLSNVRENI